STLRDHAPRVPHEIDALLRMLHGAHVVQSADPELMDDGYGWDLVEDPGDEVAMVVRRNALECPVEPRRIGIRVSIEVDDVQTVVPLRHRAEERICDRVI